MVLQRSAVSSCPWCEHGHSIPKEKILYNRSDLTSPLHILRNIASKHAPRSDAVVARCLCARHVCQCSYEGPQQPVHRLSIIWCFNYSQHFHPLDCLFLWYGCIVHPHWLDSDVRLCQMLAYQSCGTRQVAIVTIQGVEIRDTCRN
jgi:hypothetical protein